MSTPRLLLLQLLLPLSLFFTYHAPSCLNGTHVERSSVTAATTAGHTSRRKKNEAGGTGLSISLSPSSITLSSSLTHSNMLSHSHTHPGPSLSPFYHLSWGGKKKAMSMQASNQNLRIEKTFLFQPPSPSLSTNLFYWYYSSSV